MDDCFAGPGGARENSRIMAILPAARYANQEAGSGAEMLVV
jgi:hypothetical protein